MKYFNYAVIGIGIAGMAFSFGMFYETTTGTCDIFDVETNVKEAYCEILKPETKIVTVTEYVPRYIKTVCDETECDCTPEMEEGRVFGWAECVDSYNTVTEEKQNKEEQYCKEHYCKTPVLRNTRPNTRR